MTARQKALLECFCTLRRLWVMIYTVYFKKPKERILNALIIKKCGAFEEVEVANLIQILYNII